MARRPAAAVVHRDPEHLCLNDPPPFFNSRTDRLQKKSWTPLLVQDLPAHANTEVILEGQMHLMELLRTTGPPLVVAELLLDQEQVGLQLVPLKDDVTHLLLGETRLVRILPLFRCLIQGYRCCATMTGLMGQKRGGTGVTF